MDKQRTVRLGALAACLASSCLPRERDVAHERPEKSAAETQEEEGRVPSNATQRVSPATKRPPEVTTLPRSPSPKPPRRTADPRLKGTYQDAFERVSLGDDWRPTSPVWRIIDGQLCAQGARNHPVWLARRLPTNARIEFDATSYSGDGDIKAEFWGDGRSAASGTSYQDATSYLTIYGGWKNRTHVLARLDEHGDDRLQLAVDPSGADFRAAPVVAEQRYHFKVTRTEGRRLKWYVDDIEIHTLEDEHPLKGPGHEHFGFNDWEVRVCFDNLRVTAL